MPIIAQSARKSERLLLFYKMNFVAGFENKLEDCGLPGRGDQDKGTVKPNMSDVALFGPV